MTVLTYPFTVASVKDLKAGDPVRLSGRLFTGRDRLHRYLAEDGKSPVDLRDGAIYHCGPIALKKDRRWRIRAAGPTTSMRQERYMSRIIARHQVRVVLGKGGMGEATRKACARHGCVYLNVIGGTASLLAASITDVMGVHFLREFGMAEALWELEVVGLDAVVAIDANGRSLQKRVEAVSRRNLKQLLNGNGVLRKKKGKTRR